MGIFDKKGMKDDFDSPVEQIDLSAPAASRRPSRVRLSAASAPEPDPEPEPVCVRHQRRHRADAGAATGQRRAGRAGRQAHP